MDIGPNLTSVFLQWVTPVSAIAGAVTAYIGYLKTKQLGAKVVAVEAKVEEVKIATDGMSTKLAAAAFKDGKDLGKAEEQHRASGFGEIDGDTK